MQLNTNSLKNTGGSVPSSGACTCSGPGTGTAESCLGVGHGSFEGSVLFEGSGPFEGQVCLKNQVYLEVEVRLEVQVQVQGQVQG